MYGSPYSPLASSSARVISSPSISVFPLLECSGFLWAGFLFPAVFLWDFSEVAVVVLAVVVLAVLFVVLRPGLDVFLLGFARLSVVFLTVSSSCWLRPLRSCLWSRMQEWLACLQSQRRHFPLQRAAQPASSPPARWRTSTWERRRTPARDSESPPDITPSTSTADSGGLSQ